MFAVLSLAFPMSFAFALLHTGIAHAEAPVELPHSAIYLDYCGFIQSCQHSMLSKVEGSELGLCM